MEALIEGRVDPVPLTSDAASVLLVAVANDDRAARIATFLKESGFRPAITTYETVTKEACDANDVVIADSPYFGKVKGARKHALKFPETASPLADHRAEPATDSNRRPHPVTDFRSPRRSDLQR